DQSYWKRNWSEVTLDSVAANFDDDNATLVLSADGRGKMSWQGDQHLMEPLSLGDVVDYKRDPGPNDSAPYLVAFPSFSRVVERIKLPNGGINFAIVGDDVDRIIA